LLDPNYMHTKHRIVGYLNEEQYKKALQRMKILNCIKESEYVRKLIMEDIKKEG